MNFVNFFFHLEIKKNKNYFKIPISYETDIRGWFSKKIKRYLFLTYRHVDYCIRNEDK